MGLNPEESCQSCLLSGRSDVLPKRKNVGREDWDIQSKAGKVSEKRDEKLDGDQPAAVGTRSHRRNSRRAQGGDEIGVELARGGDRFGRRFETVREEEGGSRE